MKALRITLLLCSLFLISSAEAQEVKDQTYSITGNGTVTDVQPYIDALNNSDMRYHRLRNTRHTITFDTGVSVQIFSASEMNASGRSLVLTDYPESFAPNAQVPLFSLGPNNIILEQRQVLFKQ